MTEEDGDADRETNCAFFFLSIPFSVSFLLMSVCLSLCVYLCLAPFLSLPFPLSLSFSLSLSHPAPLYLFPSLLLSLTLPLSPCPSHSAPLSLSPFPPSLHLSLAAGFSQPWPISIYISGYTSGTVHCATITCTGSSGDHHSRPPSFLLLSNQLALNLLPSTFIFAANYPCIFQ